MLFAYEKFEKLVEDTKNVHTLYEYIENVMKAPFDYSDLLRWQWIQCVSAFDKLIHDLVRIGMIEVFQGQRIATAKFNAFSLDYLSYNEMLNNPIQRVQIFEQKIILKHSYLAFQDPSKVADALSYIWNENDKWLKIANKVGIDKNACLIKLKNIVSRRNQIVHEGDYADTLSQRQEIYSSDVVDIRNFILKVGEGIYLCVK
ncbi:HEPN domain-containing protein [Robinsoniella sp. KNHs210]|uniref:HEPN domain-containing protein n=1 Tax=Robinsoniella sp. KNHs210 TaxID=1469950 RepID=UPI000482B570|nr:HEPN domain-containing protein [Robinsoniella sp. KNHs210]